jgi:hypothetical protein
VGSTAAIVKLDKKFPVRMIESCRTERKFVEKQKQAAIADVTRTAVNFT